MSGRTILLLSAIVLVGGGCVGRSIHGRGEGRRSSSAREAIRVISTGMEDAFYKGDAATIAQAYADDAEWYVPQAPVIKGRPAIARAWKANAGSGGNRLRIEVAEVEQSGTRAHEVGRFTISAPDGGVLAAGKYIAIWTRQSDGEWKTRRDIFNWDVPPHPPISSSVP